MSHKKDKERWLRIQENKNKGCHSCIHLEKDESGNYTCGVTSFCRYSPSEIYRFNRLCKYYEKRK